VSWQFDGVDDRGEFEENAVAGRLHETPVMLRHHGVRCCAMFTECASGPDLVEAMSREYLNREPHRTAALNFFDQEIARGESRLK
jgi:hypothetical protein